MTKPAVDKGFNPIARRKSREFVLQALYQWHISQDPISDIEFQFLTYDGIKKADLDYFRELLQGIAKNRDEIDTLFSQFLDRKINELTPVELVIMRIGTYELKYRLDIPYRVVINEALELSKKFGALEGHKYVNGILDQVSMELRQIERNMKK